MATITVKTAAAAAAVATTTSQDKKEEAENNLKQQQRQQNFVLNLCLVSYFCFGIALHAPFVFTSVSFFFIRSFSLFSANLFE